MIKVYQVYVAIESVDGRVLSGFLKSERNTEHYFDEEERRQLVTKRTEADTYRNEDAALMQAMLFARQHNDYKLVESAMHSLYIPDSEG